MDIILKVKLEDVKGNIDAQTLASRIEFLCDQANKAHGDEFWEKAGIKEGPYITIAKVIAFNNERDNIDKYNF